MGAAPVWLKEKYDYFDDQYSEVDGNDLRFKITVVISLIKVRSNVFVSSPLDLLKFFTENGNHAFPNLRLALQFMLTIFTSTGSWEQSFSKLKLILTHLRSTMTQQRLCDLGQTTIYRSTAEKIHFTKILKEKRHFIKAPILNSIFHFTFFFSCVTSVKELPTRAKLFQLCS